MTNTQRKKETHRAKILSFTLPRVINTGNAHCYLAGIFNFRLKMAVILKQHFAGT